MSESTHILSARHEPLSSAEATGRDPWWFRARHDTDSQHPAGILDADTFDIEFDLGFGNSHRTRGRIVEIDSAETWFVRHDSAEYEMGMRHKTFFASWLADAYEYAGDRWPLLVHTAQVRGTRDRWLVDLYRRTDGQRYVDAFLERWPAFTYPRTDSIAAGGGGS